MQFQITGFNLTCNVDGVHAASDVLEPVNAGDNISTTGTITSGTLNLNQNAEIIFEGATADGNETTPYSN